MASQILTATAAVGVDEVTPIVVVGVQGEGQLQLLHVVQAERDLRLALGLGQGRQEQCSQDGYDRNHHQQLNQGKRGAWFRFQMAMIAITTNNSIRVNAGLGFVFISLQLSILYVSCRRVCGGGRRFWFHRI